MTLALALNETLENLSLNLSLQTAIEAVMFSGASVSYNQLLISLYYKRGFLSAPIGFWRIFLNKHILSSRTNTRK